MVPFLRGLFDFHHAFRSPMPGDLQSQARLIVVDRILRFSNWCRAEPQPLSGVRRGERHLARHSRLHGNWRTAVEVRIPIAVHSASSWLVESLDSANRWANSCRAFVPSGCPQFFHAYFGTDHGKAGFDASSWFLPENSCLRPIFLSTDRQHGSNAKRRLRTEIKMAQLTPPPPRGSVGRSAFLGQYYHSNLLC